MWFIFISARRFFAGTASPLQPCGMDRHPAVPSRTAQFDGWDFHPRVPHPSRAAAERHRYSPTPNDEKPQRGGIFISMSPMQLGIS